MLVEEEQVTTKRRKITHQSYPPQPVLQNQHHPTTNTGNMPFQSPSSCFPASSHQVVPSSSLPATNSITASKQQSSNLRPPSSVNISKDLGTYVARDSKLLTSLGWRSFVQQRRPRGDFSQVDSLQHPASPLLLHYKKHGVPVRLKTKPWSEGDTTTAMQRGAHQSCFN